MKRSLLFVALGFLLAAGAWAGTTGSLSGTVQSNSGDPLPGVTVTASSPSQIGGERVVLTNAEGDFSLPRLAPGVYSVRFDLDSFVSQQRTDVEIRLDQDTKLFVDLSSGEFSDQVLVTAETPVVDTKQTELAQTFTEEYLQKTSVGSTNRTYLNVFGETAGATSRGGNGIVFGSTTDENAYLVDGLDTTDPVTATFGVQLNFDAIEHMSLKTAAFDAEYGRATGGVLSVVTKSGGNDFEGTLDARYRDTSFTEEGEHFDPDLNENEQADYSGTLGGYVVQDKLWFFLAKENFDAERTPSGAPRPTKVDSQNDMAKLTYQIGDEWNVVGKWQRDPADFDNLYVNNFDSIETAGLQEQGGDVLQLSTAGVLTDSLLFDAAYQTQRQELNAFPSTGDIDTPTITDFGTGANSLNYPNAQFSERDRDEFKSSLTYFLDGAAGDHELKAGVEYSDLRFLTQNNTVGGLQYGDVFSDIYLLYLSSVDPPNEFDGTVQGAYVQDAWQVAPNVTLRLGVRYDEASFDDDFGAQAASIDKVQPRLGVAWDITGDGKTVGRISAGRFMHPNALTLPSFARQNAGSPTGVYISCEWTEINLGEPRDQCAANRGGPLFFDPLNRDPSGWWFLTAFGSGGANSIDPDLNAMYADHYVVSVEREIARRTSLELSYVQKETKDIFEDTCDGNLPVPGGSSSCSTYVMSNLDGLIREYEGLLLRFESRFKPWLHLRANYAYSKSEGNIEDTQNAGIDYDIFPDHYVNTYGYLSDDRRHRVNVTGYVDLPMKFGIGFSGFWSDDFAYSLTRQAAAGSYGTIFVEPRGSFRANSNYQLDLQLSKGFKIGNVEITALAAIFNAFDSERPTSVCQRQEGCGSLSHGDPLTFQRPRGYEAGLRLTF